jgi:hypothetical protein
MFYRWQNYSNCKDILVYPVLYFDETDMIRQHKYG